MPRLETDRLLLRGVESADLPALLAVNGDDDVTRYLPYASWHDMTDAQAWYERVCDRHEKGVAMQFAVVDKRSGLVIGSCLLFNFDEAAGHIEVGYVLGKAHWGAGYMREAVAALIGYAFESLESRRVEAIADPRNLASCRLLLGLGFTYEGRLRERWIKGGELEDGNWYGLLRREWEARGALADDEAQIDALAAAFFAAFSPDAGGRVDLDAMRRLFVPQAVIVKTCGADPEIYDLDHFIAPRARLLNDGTLTDFREAEVAHRTDICGHVAQRFCIYEKSWKAAGRECLGRGVKMIQFVRMPQGWKISALAWDDEREDWAVDDTVRARLR